jgi:hypothetical protein
MNSHGLSRSTTLYSSSHDRQQRSGFDAYSRYRHSGGRFESFERSSLRSKFPEDRLSQRIRDMNISTSFVSECDAESHSSSPKKSLEVDQGFRPVSDAPGSFRHSCLPQALDKRQAVLEWIGTMLDEESIIENEASTTIGLAMLDNGTHERIYALLQSRKTMAGKASFLRLWLRTMTKQYDAPEPSPIAPIANAVVTSTVDESDFMRPLIRSQSNCNLDILPIPSPPLVPVSLNFADASPTEDTGVRPSRPQFHGLAKFVKYNGQRISTPSTAMSPSPELTMARLGSQSSDD